MKKCIIDHEKYFNYFMELEHLTNIFYLNSNKDFFKIEEQITSENFPEIYEELPDDITDNLSSNFKDIFNTLVFGHINKVPTEKYSIESIGYSRVYVMIHVMLVSYNFINSNTDLVDEDNNNEIVDNDIFIYSKNNDSENNYLNDNLTDEYFINALEKLLTKNIDEILNILANDMYLQTFIIDHYLLASEELELDTSNLHELESKIRGLNKEVYEFKFIIDELEYYVEDIYNILESLQFPHMSIIEIVDDFVFNNFNINSLFTSLHIGDIENFKYQLRFNIIVDAYIFYYLQDETLGLLPEYSYVYNYLKTLVYNLGNHNPNDILYKNEILDAYFTLKNNKHKLSEQHYVLLDSLKSNLADNIPKIFQKTLYKK